jgi:hypothetical protein
MARRKKFSPWQEAAAVNWQKAMSEGRDEFRRAGEMQRTGRAELRRSVLLAYASAIDHFTKAMAFEREAWGKDDQARHEVGVVSQRLAEYA